MKIYGEFLKSSVLCKNALDIGGKDTKTTGTLGKSTNTEIELSNEYLTRTLTIAIF